MKQNELEHQNERVEAIVIEKNKTTVAKKMQRTLTKYNLLFIDSNTDGSINVSGTIDISARTKKFKSVPRDLQALNIYKLIGRYECAGNRLSSFEGSPKIITENLYIWGTILEMKNMTGFPIEIQGDIYSGGGLGGVIYYANLQIIKAYQRIQLIQEILVS